MVVYMLDNVESGIPLFGFSELNAEGMNQATIDHFDLAICMRVKGHGVLKVTT